MKPTAAIATMIVVLDQLSKLAVVHWLDLKSRIVIEIWPGLLNFHMAWNRGVNFGLLSNNTEIMRWTLVALALGVSIWLLMWSRRFSFWPGKLLSGLVVGGALGNGFDRVIYGAVADFLNVTCCGLINPFAFNIADGAIFVGAIGLVLFSNRLDINR